MDVDEDEISQVGKTHFEEAMRFARRSVSDQVIINFNCYELRILTCQIVLHFKLR
jgi:hypothetical protein